MFYIYSKDGCNFCEKAKDILTERGLKYEVYNISENPAYKEELLEKVPDAKTVPQIFENDIYIGGYTDLRKRIQW